MTPAGTARGIDYDAAVGAHVGLIGRGRWGQNLLRDLKSLGVRVTVVARSPESRSRAEHHESDARGHDGEPGWA